MIVVKVGGRSLANLTKYVVPDLLELRGREEVVVVHGGANEVTDFANKLGKGQRFITSPEGVRSRYTDESDIEIYVMVMAGLVNKRVVVELNRAGLEAVGISGLDGGTLRASRKQKLVAIDQRGRRVVTDGGYTGNLESVDSRLIMTLLRQGYMPIISPVALGNECEPLNVDSDAVASIVSAKIGADRLILMTDVEGIRVDGELISKLNVSEVDGILKKIGFGMNRKILEAKRAVSGGVKEAIIAPSFVESPIRKAIHHEVGTVIYG